MIASAYFHETPKNSAAEFVPGLRRIDELLPLVLARYAAVEPSPRLATECRDEERREFEFVATARERQRVLPR
jgi:hypothetical protein